MKNLKLLPLLLLFTISCTSSPDLTQITKDFYAAMEAHDHPKIVSFYADSVRVMGDGYRTVYTKEAYADWVAWDAIFAPTYEILSLTEGDNYVDAQIRKSDPRILFLNGAPYITTEGLHFEKGKLQSLEIIEEQYNEARWIETRAAFLNWIAENHPELDGFIFDQSELGAQNYMKAMELFENRKTN